MTTSTVRPMLRRREAAQYVRETYGVPCAEKSLAKLAVVGGGPTFRRYGRLPMYDPEHLDEWVRSKLSQPIRSTAELDEATAGSERRNGRR